MAVTIGCYIPNRGVLASPETIRIAALLAEACGYDSLCLEDHIVLPKRISSPYPYTATAQWGGDIETPYYEMLTCLAYLAGITTTVRLMTHVLVAPYRNPVYAAKVLASIDQLAGGRLIVGVGTGWMEDEFRILGHGFFRERGTVTDEYVRLFKELWTKASPEFHGRFYDVSEIAFFPKPAQKPHPPIWMGGRSNAALRRAARLADVWFPTGYRRPSGLEPAEGLAAPELQQRITLLKEYVREERRSPPEVEVGLTTDVTLTSSGQSDSVGPFVGNGDKVARDFREYIGVGVKHFVVTFRTATVGALFDSIDRFSREVRPQLD